VYIGCERERERERELHKSSTARKRE
jgi:hypothetical protein